MRDGCHLRVQSLLLVARRGLQGSDELWLQLLLTETAVIGACLGELLEGLTPALQVDKFCPLSHMHSDHRTLPPTPMTFPDGGAYGKDLST